MEWQGVGDRPAKKREARLLSKGEQPPYSGARRPFPSLTRGQGQREKLGVGKQFFPTFELTREAHEPRILNLIPLILKWTA